jgi:hypothetical protein
MTGRGASLKRRKEKREKGRGVFLTKKSGLLA